MQKKRAYKRTKRIRENIKRKQSQEKRVVRAKRLTWESGVKD